MSDLNVMMREQALSGLNTQLDAAVTDGDVAKAREITGKIAALQVATAPKAPPYGDVQIKAELEKTAAWYGVDPKKTAKVAEFGKTMDPRKFATAEAFAAALIKAVDAEFPAPRAAGKSKDEEGEDDPTDDDDLDANDEENPDDTDGDPKPKKPRKTQTSPNEDGTRIRPTGRTSSTVWAKLSDAPREIQTEVKRQADKFAPKTKEGREDYVKRALESHHRIALQKKAAKK